MNYKKLLHSLYLFTLIVFAPNIQAQSMLLPGDPDPTFGTNGRVLTENQASDHLWYGDMALQPDGKIIVLSAGYYSRHGYQYHFILTRYNPDGALDGTFGHGGIEYYPIPPPPPTGSSENAYAKSVYLQPDGKILIAGTIGYDFGMLRVNTNGDLDYDFGENGVVRTDFAGFEEESEDWFRDLIVRPDGKILAYGQSDFQSAINPCTSTNPCQWWVFKRRLAIAQYNSDGSLDTTFGVNGLQKSRFTNSQDNPGKMFVQPDGKILLTGGFSWLIDVGGAWGLQGIAGVVRYNSDGTVDRNFGKNGLREMQDYSDFYLPLPDGKMLGVSHCPSYSCSWSNYNVNTKIVRYNADFTLDTSFAPARHFLQTSEISGVNLQADGKMIFSTYTSTYNNARTIIYRFNPDGSTDFSFGTNGAIVFDMDNSNAINSYPFRTVILPDGKILLGGRFYAISGTLDGVGNILMRLIGEIGKSGF
jgi:uncharacterized delta-60 repeat protein